jgi:hypothetical protein
MSVRSFRSVFMVGGVAGAALSCYLVSLRVASERAALENVETEIVLAQRDIRLLQTEIGTRGRLAQLERWNVKVLSLSAPSADQFLEGGFQLARLGRPEPQINVDAPVVLASAPAPRPQSAPLVEGERVADGGAGATPPAAQLMREASLKLPQRRPAPTTVKFTQAPRPPITASKTATALKTVTASKPTAPRVAAAPRAAPKKLATAPKKAGDNKVQASSRPVTKPVRTANLDPLAPLSTRPASGRTTKDSGTAP